MSKVDNMNMQGKKLGVLMVTIVLVFSLAQIVAVAETTDDVPPIPDSFHGELTINGFNASEETELQARINEVPRGNITTEQPGYYGNPDELRHLDVQGTNDDIGEPIDFYRKEDGEWIEVSETDPEDVEFEGGQTERVDLEFSTGMPVSVSAPEDQIETELGTYTYEYEVTNDGEYDDTYSLTASSTDPEKFSVEVADEIDVSSESTENVEVDVTIEDEAEFDDNSEIELTVESQNYPNPSDSDYMLITFEEPPYYFAVDIDEAGSDTEVVEGEDLDVVAEVENLGEEETTQMIELYEGEDLLDSQELTLGDGESDTITLTWETTVGESGSYTLEVNSEDDTDDLEVTVLQEANFAVDIDEAGSDTEVIEGEDLDVVTEVENLGEEETTQMIELYEGEDLLDSQELTLGDSESDTITLTWNTEVDDVGEYTVEVKSEDDVDDLEVTVLEADEIFELDVDLEGNGIIELNGEEITTPYAQEYTEGTVVTLEAISDKGWELNEWYGDVNSEEEEIDITIDQDLEIIARFVLEYEPQITELEPDQGDNISGENVVFSARLDHPEDLDIDTASVTFSETGLVLQATVNEDRAILELPFSLEEGQYTYEMLIVDENGESHSTEVDFSVDNTPPEIEVTSPEGGLEQIIDEELDEEGFIIEGEIYGATELQIDGDEVEIDENNSFEYETTLEKGLNQFLILAQDDVGNQAEIMVEALYLPDISELWNSIDAINNQINAIQDDIADIEDDIADIETDIAGIEDDIDELEDDIAYIEEELADLWEAIDELEGNIEEIEDDLDDIWVEIEAIEDQIADLESEIADLEDEQEDDIPMARNLGIVGIILAILAIIIVIVAMYKGEISEDESESEYDEEEEMFGEEGEEEIFEEEEEMFEEEEQELSIEDESVKDEE